ncbi:MAG: YabP/YqfC family sporulation protein [Clostridia bacterium]|nr:YabP/YqfC family sporulation protein [Clostridia bacterium]
MGLYEEVLKTASGGVCSRCVIVPGGGGYFEGVKAIGDFSSEKIIVCFPKQTVEITGQNLVIKKYYDGDLQVDGRLLSVCVVPTEAEVNR